MTDLPKLAVFCDFDGTVSIRDVGYSMFRHFSDGRIEVLLPDWKAGRLSTRDCLVRETEMVDAPAEEILAFLDQFEIDPTFEPFVRTCREAGVPVQIVSEGMDLYIRKVLGQAGLSDLPLICNHGELRNRTIHIEFPHQNHHCRRCGNCKGERIVEYRNQCDTRCVVAFVGDGYSDACAAREADLLFAKDDLERYCLDEEIAYNRFDDFQDVARHLKELGYLTF